MNEEDSIKVVLIGESGVGKTSIIAQFIEQEYQENRLPTNGATFFTKTITEEHTKKEVKFEIWDTAGQEKYRSLTSMFYKDASIAILVYDITREESFEAIRNYWVEQINENGPENFILAIAANKSDLYEIEKVTEQIGREYANSIGAIFKLTTAKNYESINNLFQVLAQQYLDPKNKLNNVKEDNEELAQPKCIKIEEINNKNDQEKEKEKKKRKCC